MAAIDVAIDYDIAMNNTTLGPIIMNHGSGS